MEHKFCLTCNKEYTGEEEKCPSCREHLKFPDELIDGKYVWRCMWRALGYSLTSWMAFISGFIVEGNSHITFINFGLSEVITLIIPIFLSYSFFSSYVLYIDKYWHGMSFRKKYFKSQKFTYNIALIASISSFLYLLTVLLFVGNDIAKNLYSISYGIFYAAILIVYGNILRGFKKIRKPLVYQIVGPVLITIGFAIYCGYATSKMFFNYVKINEYLTILSPLAVVLIAFWYYSQPKRVNYFAKKTLAILVLWLATLIFFGNIKMLPKMVKEYHYLMLLCISLSAYFGFFECWKITKYYANKQQPFEIEDEYKSYITATINWFQSKFRSGVNSVKSEMNGNGCDGYKLPLIKRLKNFSGVGNPDKCASTLKLWPYYSMTLVAGVLSAFFVPLVYIFSDNSFVFVFFFCINTFLGVLVWSVRGYKLQNIKQKRWDSLKTIFGYLFLIAFVLDSIKPAQQAIKNGLHVVLGHIDPSNEMWKSLGTFGALFALIALSSIPASKLYRKFIECVSENGAIGWNNLFNRRRDVFRLGSIFGVLFILIIYLVFYIYGLKNADPHYPTKVLQTLISYSVFLLLILLAEVVYPLLDKVQFNEITKSIDAVNEDKAKSEAGHSLINNKIVGFFQCTRLFTGSIVGVSIVLPGIFRGFSLRESIAQCLPFVLTAMGGFAVNDYFDEKKDKINKPWRAIPSGKIDGREVFIVGKILLFLGFLSALVTSLSVDRVLLVALAITGVFYYNLINSKIGIIKTIYTGCICSIPIFYDVIVFGYNSMYYLLPISTIAFITGREMLMDCIDVPGDKFGLSKTLPLYIGTNYVSKIAFILQASSLATMIPLIFYISNIFAFSVFIINSILFVFFMIAWSLMTNNSHRIIIKLMHAQMFGGIILLII